MLSMTYMYIRQAYLFMVMLTIMFKHMYACIFVKALIHSGVNMITQECLDRIMKFEYNIVNKAYRPNAHLLYIVMHYNGNII